MTRGPGLEEVDPTTEFDSSRTAAQRRDPDRKQKILSAAADLVAQRGFHSVSMAEIGVEVGISGAAIYRHFESKSALLVALFDRAIDELLEDERQSVARTLTHRSALGRLVERQIDFVVYDRDFARVYHSQVENLPDEDRARLRGKQRLYLEEWIRLLREVHGGLDDAGARTLVHAAIGAIQSPLFHNVHMSQERLKVELTRVATAVLGLESSAGR